MTDRKRIMPRRYLGIEGFFKLCRSSQSKTLHVSSILTAVWTNAITTFWPKFKNIVGIERHVLDLCLILVHEFWGSKERKDLTQHCPSGLTQLLERSSEALPVSTRHSGEEKRPKVLCLLPFSFFKSISDPSRLWVNTGLQEEPCCFGASSEAPPYTYQLLSDLKQTEYGHVLESQHCHQHQAVAIQIGL